MKMRGSIVMLLAVLLTGQALAGGNTPIPDQIGVYYDELAEFDCSENVEGMITTYVVLTELTSSSISGWEAKITAVGDGAVMTGVTYRGLAIDAATRTDEYMVGLGEPLAAVDGTVVVMDMGFYFFDSLVPLEVFVGPVYYHTADEALPCYLDGDDVNLAIALTPSSGDVETPVFEANGNCTGPVADEAASWGDVKSLYR